MATDLSAAAGAMLEPTGDPAASPVALWRPAASMAATNAKAPFISSHV